ncbi:cation:dicarboxylate symporter family transporter [Streptomyces sp. NBC_01451]|uniref:cation:dicarboxylate symporter family transporter n=1 Tax=Streptomyces sp. NBC_01451 TaxID=2903872 RepID=UPI002E33C76D|nr:cation:dicarboxylase symporter family transporter [Streptomyces sp. NBC_01451]
MDTAHPRPGSPDTQRHPRPNRRPESVRKVGRIAGKAILCFELVTTVILVIAVGLARFADIGKSAPVRGADAEDLDGLSRGIDFHELLLHAVPKNIFAAFGEGNLLGAIVFALLSACPPKASPCCSAWTSSSTWPAPA